MIIIVVSGVLKRYVSMSRIVRDYWKSLHIPLTVILYLALGIHVIDKIGIL